MFKPCHVLPTIVQGSITWNPFSFFAYDDMAGRIPGHRDNRKPAYISREGVLFRGINDDEWTYSIINYKTVAVFSREA